MSRDALDEQRHPALRRIAHWGMAVAILIMIGSGWRIFDSSPVFCFHAPGCFHFPLWMTIGGTPAVSYALHDENGLANALLWHFAGMWLLAASFLLYVAHGLASGHFRRDFLPIGPGGFVRDLYAAITLRLVHRLGAYNAVQRVFYVGVLISVAVMIASGLAIWKPVQLGWLAWLFGGYPVAREMHFFFMVLIVAFILVHVVLAAIVPKTLLAMTIGRARAAFERRAACTTS